MTVVLAGLFGHRAAPQSAYAVWAGAVAHWINAHWQVIAVLVPLLGAILAGILNHYLSVVRDNRARRLARADTRARVHADLAARLLAHCSYLQRASAAAALDAAAWRRSNEGLRARAEMSDLIDVLGPNYVSFMAAIERERTIVNELRDGTNARAAREVMRLYAPFIAEFGEPVQARRLERA